MSPRRLISGVVTAVLLLTCVLVLPGATDVARAGKSYETALPQYVQGYWPGEDPRLCIWDVTDGDYPITEAVAQYDAVTGVEMHVTTGVVACLPGESIVGMVEYSTDLPCGDYDGCWVRDDRSFRDSEGLWVHSSGSYVALNSRMHDHLTEDQWVALIAHEFGHALGLAHTNRRDSVMHQAEVQAGTVTATDIAVLNELYSGR